MAQLPVVVTPAEATTVYNLVLIGLIGGIGVVTLTELIKNKTAIPVNEIVKWGAVTTVVAVASVWAISRASK